MPGYYALYNCSELQHSSKLQTKYCFTWAAVCVTIRHTNFFIVAKDILIPKSIPSFTVGLLKKMMSHDRVKGELIQIQNFSFLFLPWPSKSFKAPASVDLFFPLSFNCLPWPSPPIGLCFLLFRPSSLCQQIPSINRELSLTRVTIGSCR